MRRPAKVRQRARKDANHGEIIREFEALGCSVLDLSQLPRALDLLVGISGCDVRVEVKDGSLPPSKRQLTSEEQEEISQWRGRPPEVVQSLGCVHRLVSRVRRRQIQASV